MGKPRLAKDKVKQTRNVLKGTEIRTLKDKSKKLQKERNWHDELEVPSYNSIKIKKQFVDERDISEVSCLCGICESATMMEKTSKKYKSDHPTDAHHIENKCCCGSIEFSCMSSTCGKCSVTNVMAK